MKLKKYFDFLIPLFESEVVYSDKFKNIIKKIDSPVATALLDMESKDLDVANNYIDIGDNKNQVTFITDRKAKEILSSPESKLVKHLGSGFLTHSDANAEIFSQLDYTPEGSTTYHPQTDELGEIISETTAPSGRIYCKVKFPGGISVINKERLQKSDVTKLPFKKNRQPGRVGATIQGLLRAANQSFSNAEIEVFVNKYKSEFDRFNDVFRNFELVSGRDIYYWYQYQNYLHGKSKGQLSHSCMAAASDRWLQIYTHNPDVCNLLILKADEDESKIKGRALVWKLSEPSGITYVDRIYTHDDSDIELFKQYVAQQGWYLKKRYTSSTDDSTMIAPDGTETRPKELSVQVDPLEYGGYPYLDTLKFYTPSSGKLSTDSSGEYQLEDTGGGYSNQSCDHCGGDGYVECGECYGRGRLRCDECNRGKIECPECNGSGELECETCSGYGTDSEGNTCGDCGGDGTVKCEDCEGNGERECPDCDGEGSHQCEYCDGEGQNSCSECNW